MNHQKNRWIAAFTAMVMAFCMGAGFALPAFAEGPIEITTAEQLIAISYGGLDGDYIQKADIDLTGKAFAPIGSIDAPFTGSYDGNGYLIDGLNLSSRNQFQGLFGVNDGTIRNVTLGANCSIGGSAFVGAIAGRNNGIIEDCISDADVVHVAANETQGSVYKILSQNLCQWGDDSLASSSSYVDSTTNSRRPAMLQRIRNADPDIMLFQEVSFSDRTMHGKNISGWDKYLKAQLTDYNFVGDYRSNRDKEGVTVAYKSDKFTCLKSGMFWLSPNPDADRSQQTAAWGAGCVRTCAWVLLEDNETHEQIAAYSVHLDHIDNVPLPRENGAKVVKAKMEALREEYPDAYFVVGGDYNEDPGDNGYNVTENSFDGMIDDTRYAVEAESIEDHTWEGNFASLEGATRTIDFIFADSSKLEVNSFRLMKDYYENKRPSDHHGVYAEVERVQNNGIGSIVGSNGGILRRVIAKGSAVENSAEAAGQVIGSNEKIAENIYFSTPEEAIGSGIMEEINPLPQTPGVGVVTALNKAAGRGAFTILDDEYVVVGEKDLDVPVCLTVNGVDWTVYPGEVYTLEELGLNKDAVIFFNGKIVEEDFITIPQNGGEIKETESVSDIDSKVYSGDYAVTSMADWMYLYENKEFFANREVTIHLLCHLDFSVAEAATFTTMKNPAFSFDGHGYIIKNWGTKANPIDQIGFFSVNEGAGGLNFIKNLNFENCHIWDETTDSSTGSGPGAGTTLVYAVQHSNAGLAGLPTELTIENVHVKNCSLGARNTEANAFILSRYGVPEKKINVYIRGCSVEDSVLDANNMNHKGLILGKVRCNSSQSASNQANFYIQDCIVRGNEIKNSNGLTGFVLGSVEGYGVDAYIINVGVFDNVSTGTDDGGILCYMDNGGIVCKGVLMQGNTLNHDKKYVIAAKSTPVNVVSDAIFCDNTDLTAMVENKTNTLTGGADAVASGEAAFAINKAVEEASFRWKPDGQGGYTATTESLPEYCKVVIRVGGAETVKYVEKGTTITLPEISEGEYTFTEGEGTIEGNRLVVNMDITLSCLGSVQSVTAAVTGGDYTVSSEGEWMYLYRNKSFFQNRNITIHLKADLDLSKEEAAGFAGFIDPYFSFNGHGYTIKNWGTEQNPVASKGLFCVYTGAGGLNYIKDIKLENCHLTDYEESSFSTGKKGNIGLVYSAIHGNAGLSGLLASLTLENISLKNCSLITLEEGESCALLLGRYTPASGNHTVTIKNIVIEGSTLDAGKSDHKGLLIGKPRSNNSGGRATFDVSDCYLYNNTITNADNISVGFIFGTAEMSSVTVNLRNIGVVGNTMKKSGDGALAGFSGSGGMINLERVFFFKNDVTATNKYLVAQKNGTGTIGLTDVYSDEANLTSAVMSGNHTHTVAADQLRSGEVAYDLNKKSQEPSFYWGKNSADLPIPVEEKNQIAKLTVLNEEDANVGTIYLNGGESITFADSHEYRILSNTGGSISGKTLTMPLGGKDVVLRQISATCNHQYDQENALPYGESQHEISCSNGCGAKEIVDCTFALESRGDGYHYEKCSVCGNQKEAEPCSLDYVAGEGGIHNLACSECSYEYEEECVETIISYGDGFHTKQCSLCHGEPWQEPCVLQCESIDAENHSGFCIQCGYHTASEKCIMKAAQTELPEVGQSFNGNLTCTKGCGNVQQNVILKSGDLNGDGMVGLVDVIYILQVLVGIRSADSLHCALGNFHQVDGATENGGLTVLDAAYLLRSLLQK